MKPYVKVYFRKSHKFLNAQIADFFFKKENTQECLTFGLCYFNLKR